MSDLLVRDIPEETKRALAIRAAQNGRSQQAEARAILTTALAPPQKSWIRMLIDGAAEVGGIELPPVERHTPRITGVSL